MTLLICAAIVVGCGIITAVVTFVGQKVADWWYDYTMKRELNKIIEKELRQSRREFRR